MLQAIRTEYGVEVVDENDHRFWGFSSEEAMLGSFGSVTVSNNSAADQCVVIEGPLSHDVAFAILWDWRFERSGGIGPCTAGFVGMATANKAMTSIRHR